MELRAFNHQMARLAAAFNYTLTSHAQTVYWERLQKHSEPAFVAAVNKMLDTQDRFPPIGKIKDALRTGTELERRAPIAEHTPRPPVTLADLDPGAVRAVPTQYRAGTPMHTAYLRAADRLIAGMEARLSERMAEQEAGNADPDLARRISVIGRTLAYEYQWREHFARTGESLHWEVAV